MKFKINAPVDYVSGYIRYGHYEGVVNIPEEDMEKFTNDPIKYLYDHDYLDDLELVIDGVAINDVGEITSITYVNA